MCPSHHLSPKPALSLYSRPKRRRAPEQSFQREVVRLLKMMLSDTAVVFHGANEGKRTLVAGRMLKDIGMLPGLPDLGIVDCQRIYWLELKAKGRSPTDVQKQCHTALQRAGSPVAVVRTIDDVMIAVRDWGIAVTGMTFSIPGSVTVRGAVS